MFNLRRALEISSLTASLSLFSCSTINYDHQNSCGPKALSIAINIHKEYATNSEISRRIIDKGRYSGNIWRNFLNKISFNKRALGITWPSEIRDSLEHYLSKPIHSISHYSKTPSENRIMINDLIKRNKNGVALIRNIGDHFSYHWSFFGKAINPNYDFGERKLISDIYIIHCDKKLHHLSKKADTK
jgi:hypothetical protein